jgi:hypothetical protein
LQRRRLGRQRELNRRTALEVAYSGSYADRQGMQIRQDYLPEQYWSNANVRDTSANDFLTQNVPNPFLAELCRLRTMTLLRLLGSATFTRRPYSAAPAATLPHMNNLRRDQALSEIKRTR